MALRNAEEFETRLARLIAPTDGYWPRPWFTDHDPMTCDLLLVGASSAKSFSTSVIPDRATFMDAHFNRNGSSSRSLYERLTETPSPSRKNIDRAVAMFEADGWRVMQTNVACASAPMDGMLTAHARLGGHAIFKAVVDAVPWRAMVVFGTGATKDAGRVLGTRIAPAGTSAPSLLNGKPIVSIPTLAPPAYEASVWDAVDRSIAQLRRYRAMTQSPSSKPETPATIRPARDASQKITPDITGGRAVRTTAEALDDILDDFPVLSAERSTTQSRIDLPDGRRIFRIKHGGHNCDLLVHFQLLPLDGSVERRLGLTVHKNPDFRRLFSDDTSKLLELLKVAGAGIDQMIATAARRERA